MSIAFVIIALAFYFCIVYPLLKFWLDGTLARAERIAYGTEDGPRRINDRGRTLPDEVQTSTDVASSPALKTIEVTAVLPKWCFPKVAMARMDLLDNSPGAKPFTVIRSEEIILLHTPGRFKLTFRDVPADGQYAVYAHVQVNREKYDAKNFFAQIQPGDYMTPLAQPLTVEPGAGTSKQEILLTELIEHQPYVGQNC